MGISACDATEPAHAIEVLRDTLVLYGTDDTPIPVRITDAEGARFHAQDAEVNIGDTAVVRRQHGWLACASEDQGDATRARPGASLVTVTSRDRSGRFVAVCRPAESFHGTHFIALTLGDSGTSLRFTASLTGGGLEPVWIVAAEASDTTIARVRGGRVIPVAVGQTTVAVNLGGVRRPVHVRVTETIARDSLELAPGEFRSWKLEPGRYEITVRGSSQHGDFTGLEMTGEGLKCVRDTRDDGIIHCIVYERAGVGLRNERTEGPVRRAVVKILRTP